MDVNDPTVLKAIEGAKENLKSHDELLPTWFIGYHDEEGKDALNIVATPFNGPDEHATKDMVARTIKKMAAECNADFLLFLSEAWMLEDSEASKHYAEHRDEYPNGLSDHPKRVEIVMFNLQTHEGTKLGRAKILPGREMGEVRWMEEFDRMGGRFSNLLPNRFAHRENTNKEE